MNFFKSVFTPGAEPDPLQSDSPHPQPNSADEAQQQQQNDHAPEVGKWGFGGLMKSLASRSESVIQTYRRDLEEFGSGFKKETEAIREAAARAVRDLPVSFEAGASAAQGSLQSVGQAIETLLSADTDEEDAYGNPQTSNSGSSKRFGRPKVQVLGLQSDQSTFLEDPEDAEDFHKWKEELFRMAEKEEEIEELCAENGVLVGFLEKLVPDAVDHETFWCRYFYKVYKLKQAEDARAMLVKRVISREEEDLSWEVEDDEEEEGQKKDTVENELAPIKENENKISGPVAEIAEDNKIEIGSVVKEKPVEKSQLNTSVEEVRTVHVIKEVESEEKMETLKSNVQVDPVTKKSDIKLFSDGKLNIVESCKDSDISAVSIQPSVKEEEDIGWDEIEDLGENDEKTGVVSGASPKQADIRRTFIAAEDDEDLSWDVEDE